MLDEIRNRMLAVEADRDTALQKADSASIAEKRIQSQFHKEKQQLSNEVGELQVLLTFSVIATEESEEVGKGIG